MTRDTYLGMRNTQVAGFIVRAGCKWNIHTNIRGKVTNTAAQAYWPTEKVPLNSLIITSLTAIITSTNTNTHAAAASQTSDCPRGSRSSRTSRRRTAARSRSLSVLHGSKASLQHDYSRLRRLKILKMCPAALLRQTLLFCCLCLSRAAAVTSGMFRVRVFTSIVTARAGGVMPLHTDTKHRPLSLTGVEKKLNMHSGFIHSLDILKFITF